MFFLEELEINKIKKTSQISFKGNEAKGNLIIFYSEMDTFSSVIQKKSSSFILNLNSVKRYLLQKITRVKSKIIPYDRSEIYKNLNDNFNIIGKNDLSDNYNTIFDISYLASYLFSNLTNPNEQKKYILEYLAVLDEDIFKEFTNKILWIYPNRNNVSLFSFILKRDISILEKFNSVIIFNGYSLVKIYDRKDKNSFDFNKYRHFYNTLSKELEEESVKITQDINDKINNSKFQIENPEEQKQTVTTEPEIFDISKNYVSTPESNNDKTTIYQDGNVIGKESEDNTNNVFDIEVKDTAQNIEAVIEKMKEVKRYDVNQYNKLLEQHKKNIENLKIEIEDENLPERKLEDKQFPSDIKNFKVNALRIEYQKKFFKRDLIKIFDNLSKDSDFPLFFKSINISNNDTGMTAQNLYAVKLQDINGKETTLSFNIPRLIENKFYYINNTKYTLTHQIYSKTILKIKPNTVAFTTNYNKLMIYRMGSDSSELINQIIRILNANSKALNLKNSTIKNTEQTKIPIDYRTKKLFDNISEFKLHDFYFNFNTNTKENSLYSDLEKFDYLIPVGRRGNIIFAINKDNELYEFDKKEQILNKKDNIDFLSFIQDLINKDKTIFENDSLLNTDNAIYTRVNIAGKKVPLILAMMTKFSLLDILKQYKISYKFTKENTKVSSINTKKIKLQDGYLIIDVTKIENKLLINGLMKYKNLDTFTYRELVNPEFNKPTIFTIDYMFDNKNIFKAIRNVMDNILDPLTLEILSREQLPTNTLDCLLYCNTLLKNDEFKKGNDFSSYRIRNEEAINAIIYKQLQNTIVQAKQEYNKTGKVGKISINPDVIVKELLVNTNNFENYSSLNYYNELDSVLKATFKGFLGLNQSRSASFSLRSPDESMTGIIDMGSNVDNANVGINKYMPINSNVLNIRGITKPLPTKGIKDYSKVLTHGVYSEPFLSSRADAPRISYAAIQARHGIPIPNFYSKPLIETGIENKVKYLVSSDFSIKNPLQEEIKIIKIDDKNKWIVVEGKTSKQRKAISFDRKIRKNGGGGFFISTEYFPCVKEGDSVKPLHPIALDNGTFTSEGTATGMKLLKCSFINLPENIEDGVLLSSKIAKEMQFNYVIKKDVIIYPNQEVIEMVSKIGDKVEVNQPLILFTSKSDSNDTSELMNKLNLDDSILETAKSKIKSKYNGEIVDIKVYYNSDTIFDEKIKSVANYLNNIVKEKKKLANEDDALIEEKVIKVDSQKLGTETVKDGILIEYYIETKMKGYTGSKITYQSTKGVYRVLDESEMPRTLDGEPLDIVISAFSLITRLTVNNPMTLYTNKLMVDMNKKLKELAK